MKGQLNYEFHGMDPSEWTEQFLNDEFSPLMDWAPKDASLKLKVERHSSGLDGKLLMYSTAGTFVVENKGDDITTLVKALRKKMKNKLHKWKDDGHHLQPGEGNRPHRAG